MNRRRFLTSLALAALVLQTRFRPETKVEALPAPELPPQDAVYFVSFDARADRSTCQVSRDGGQTWKEIQGDGNGWFPLDEPIDLKAGDCVMMSHASNLNFQSGWKFNGNFTLSGFAEEPSAFKYTWDDPSEDDVYGFPAI